MQSIEIRYNIDMKILIGDDSALIRDILAAAFQRAGYEVTTAHNGAEVLKMALNTHPDAILMDYEMPMLSGLSVLRQLKTSQMTRNIRVYLLSGISDATTLQQANEAGVQGFFVKPFDVHEVVERIRNDLAHGQ
ncbi:MAG: two-component system response regulator [Acidobacteria bacterium CG_4_9_14_3_um_filter_49_7]|nr:MAG: two-component system response regulator [Acidobacteria bacterium CG_4_9_14_3_um_filter_49_7]